MEIVQPAHLAFLAIYNPSLGPTDETLTEQLVYYYSGGHRISDHDKVKLEPEQEAREERNEQLRNIGLAQGMIAFGKSFCDTDNVDFVDSEKSRMFMHEIEPGWWVVASITLTQLRTTSTVKGAKGKSETKSKTEYSGREVGPHGLLLQQILSANAVFLLHHGSSLAEMYARVKRAKFCAALERFWNQFLKGWDVLLHGTPAVDVFSGIKLAAGGELGVGVGEEDWGSGEREVLEDFTQRTDGLIDVIVSHFDDGKIVTGAKSADSWLGSGNLPTSSDGVIYSGTGDIARSSVASISKWMEWTYTHGSSAYGVQDSPHAPKRRKKVREPSTSQAQALDAWPKGIPPPLLAAANKSLETATKKVESKSGQVKDGTASGTPGADVLMKYMTFGLYGSGWGLPITKTAGPPEGKAVEVSEPATKTSNAKQEIPEDTNRHKPDMASKDTQPQNKPYFLIGLQGSLEDDETGESREDSNAGDDDMDAGSLNDRILIRTLYIKQSRSVDDQKTNASKDTSLANHNRIQVIVYINQPFVFTFLFELNTPTLGYASFYKSVHHQLGPLRKPMLKSTSSETIRNRLEEVTSPRTISTVNNRQPIYDLIYDHENFTIHTTIPPIPDANDPDAAWSRMDALNVHLQILATKSATRHHLSEIERAAKTSRGWWVIWLNFPRGVHKHSKEAFLVRRATDYVEGGGRKGSLGFGKDMANWGTSAGRVAEGIGIDARRYVEGLISLSR